MSDGPATRNISVPARHLMSLQPPGDQRFDWRTADYAAWNRRLLDYFLGAERRGPVVERIPATPEELVAVVSDPSAVAEDATDAFVAAIRSKLPPGVSFCGFSLNYRGWTPESLAEPPLFGMLWFTCLIGSGYADHHGSFFARFRELIGTADNLRCGQPQRGCVNTLWEDMAAWSWNHPNYASLVLPSRHSHLKVIGRSYYLAFPNRHDRRILAEVLTTKELVGFEPPILPVVRAVERSRDRFTSDFRASLDHFLEYYLRGGHDPTDSAFWRAIRAEAASGWHEADDVSPEIPMTFLASWDDDETLLVRLSCTDEVPLLRSISSSRLSFAVDRWTRCLTDDAGGVDPVVRNALAGSLPLHCGLQSLVNQGVLPFIEDIAGEYRLAFGEEIDGAELALVHADRRDAFRSTFGGTVETSRFDGWYEVTDCRVHQRYPCGRGLLVGSFPCTGGPVAWSRQGQLHHRWPVDRLHSCGRTWRLAPPRHA